MNVYSDVPYLNFISESLPLLHLALPGPVVILRVPRTSLSVQVQH
jgi:hypothetical protein